MGTAERHSSGFCGCLHWSAAAATAGVLCLAAFLTSIEASSYRAAPARRSNLPPLLHEHVSRMQRLRRPHVSPLRLAAKDAVALPPGTPPLLQEKGSPRVFHVTDYGADPTGKNDSSDAISRALADAFRASSSGRTLLSGIPDLGGAEVHLDGGLYLVSRPIRFPFSAGGNFKIHSGSLLAAADFPTDGYLIELVAASSSTEANSSAATASSALDYEYVTLRDLLLDSNYRGGGLAVVNSLRTTIDNCYVAHFSTDGILVRGGHEAYIHNTYIGQHITAGADPGEKNFTAVGINLEGNDNAVTDVVIFSAATGVMVSGQANTLSGVHCYNKATGWGGTGIYLRLPGLTQTRILNCYLDYTGIVAEDPVQLLVSGSFFLGDAHVVLKSVKGFMKGVTIADNQFSGGGGGVDIVQLDQSGGQFTTVEQVVVDRNAVRGMTARATSARASARGNGTSWAVDFSSVLLFPDRIDHVQYTLRVDGDDAPPPPPGLFAAHALRRVSGNRVVVESQVPVSATVHVAVEQTQGRQGEMGQPS